MTEFQPSKQCNMNCGPSTLIGGVTMYGVAYMAPGGRLIRNQDEARRLVRRMCIAMGGVNREPD